MPTYRLISNDYLGSPTNTTVISVTSSETAFTIGSGNRAFEVSNLGTQNVYHGASAVLINSGNLLSPSASKMFDTLADNFTMYFALASGGVSANLVIVEYAGN